MGRISKVWLQVDLLEDDPSEASEVTQLIGFEPTAIVSCGFSSLPKRGSWVCEFHNPEAPRLEDDVIALVHFLEGRTEAIRRVAVRYPTVIVVHINDQDWIWPYEPNGPRSGGFELSSEFIHFASGAGLSVKVHFFCGLASGLKAGQAGSSI